MFQSLTHEIVELKHYSLGSYGHDIVEEHHAVTEDGARYFGLLSLRSPDSEYTDTLGLRNSHDKKFPIGIAFGRQLRPKAERRDTPYNVD